MGAFTESINTILWGETTYTMGIDIGGCQRMSRLQGHLR
jgi:hypothetical protein